jgi:hypothetical protein
MTLIEVIAAMAMIAVVSVICIAAFMTIIGVETRETNTRLASESAERKIASGEEATTSTAATLKMGGFKIPVNVDSYSETVGDGETIDAGGPGDGRIDISGSRNYMALRKEPEVQAPPPFFFGDGASALTSVGVAQETGGVGGAVEYPISVSGKYRIEVWGACGGSGGASSPDRASGGRGGYSVGTVNLQSGDTLYLYAGGAGKAYAMQNGAGGFNGGGASSHSDDPDVYVGSGGGASDVRIGGKTLDHRVIVAGGGGGAGGNTLFSNDSEDDTGSGGGADSGGGAGGGLCGAPGKPDGIYRGGGGAQIVGGVTGNSLADAVNGPGRFGEGGFTDVIQRQGGGGGGGWYGGGAGSYDGGGGGSGWIFTQAAVGAWSNVADRDRYALDDYGYSYQLEDAETVAGDMVNGMPDPRDTGFDPDNPTFGGRMTGNDRGGFVRLIYIGE